MPSSVDYLIKSILDKEIEHINVLMNEKITKGLKQGFEVDQLNDLTTVLTYLKKRVFDIDIKIVNGL